MKNKLKILCTIVSLTVLLIIIAFWCFGNFASAQDITQDNSKLAETMLVETSKKMGWKHAGDSTVNISAHGENELYYGRVGAWSYGAFIRIFSTQEAALAYLNYRKSKWNGTISESITFHGLPAIHLSESPARDSKPRHFVEWVMKNFYFSGRDANDYPPATAEALYSIALKYGFGSVQAAPNIPKNPKLSVAVSQVLDNPDLLVHKKPALITVNLNWDNKECPRTETQVNWIHNGKIEKSIPFVFKQSYSPNEIYQGKNTVVFGFIPDIYQNSQEKHHIEVLLKKVKDEKNLPVVLKKDVSIPVDSLGNPVINIVFVSIKIGKWDTKRIYFDQFERINNNYFKELRNKQLSFMKGVYPVPPESIIDSTQSNILMEITPAATEKYITGVTKMGILSRLEDYYNENKKEHINYVVGITPAGWLKDMGLTEAAFPHAVLIDEFAPGSVLAHEVGHHLKFKHNQDEYGKQMLTDKGCWIKSINPFVYTRKLPVQLKVNTVDFMDTDPIDANNTWICRQNYKKLIEAVKKFFGSYVKNY